MSQVTKILMVCLGNICRSPLAEAILRAKVDPEKVIVDSAGTAHYHIGEAPDPRAISTGKKYGLDLSQLRARQFNRQDFNDFDFIYAMDASNHQNILTLATTAADREKVSLLLEKTHPGQKREVPDPWFGKGEELFPEVFQLLDAACEQIAKEL